MSLLSDCNSRFDKSAKQMKTKRETNENNSESEQKVRLYKSKYRGFFTSPSYGIISMKYDYGITTT